ncbi:Predicted orf (plasmid) [Photobacterium profundum SS9]|uniref:Predicted orf n=1 Tax=Photobacterium profundum (strain SS9) TaxID=298386 RepID=Q6LWD0_PHOPR|nr:Predicted orf [Photobacterium profundum SS9]
MKRTPFEQLGGRNLSLLPWIQTVFVKHILIKSFIINFFKFKCPEDICLLLLSFSSCPPQFQLKIQHTKYISHQIACFLSMFSVGNQC